MLKNFVLAVAMLFTVATAASAADYATQDEAKAMAEKAAAHVKSAGMETAIKDFMTPGGQWHDRDLYVFVFDAKGTTIAHGAKASLVGRDLTGLRDVDGKQFIKEFLTVSDAGWVDYKWQNPTTNAVEPKSSYIIKVGTDLVGVGAYKQ
ncbi:MAG: cache domain-containing protein [Nisaea sp.]|jgi:signal transduction histidine kinase|uniref:cache domain-containing protein n=1 Tax=Nisaea sp. TaxID=2024842 RepID=UPI001B0846A6|nr:cache domain-containing protein [Nisaea sp.]MBO6562586.1 cache domain-containing protein [Nisaea sp.]